MNHVFPRWNALCVAACLLLVWTGRVEAGHIYFVNNTATNQVDPQLRYSGGVIAGGAFTVTAMSSYDWSVDTTYMQSQHNGSTRWFRAASGFDTDTIPGGSNLDGWTFTWGDPSPPSCRRTIPITNTTLQIRRGYWTLNGVVIYVEDIGPGETKTHTVAPEDCGSYTVQAYDVALMLNDDFELVPSTNLWDNVSDQAGDSTNAVTLSWKPPSAIDAGGALDSTNGSAPIAFSTAAGTNSSRAIQEGFTATLLSQQQYDDRSLQLLDAIRQNTGQTATNVSEANGTLTNILATMTNGPSADFLNDLISGAAGSAIPGIIDGLGASGTSAVSSANSDALSYAGDGVNDFASGMGLGSSAIPLAITVTRAGLGSYTMDLDPEHVGWLSTVLSVIRAAFAWFVVFWTFRKNFEAILGCYRAVNEVTPYSVGGVEEIAGCNIALPWRITVGFVIIALVATIPALWVTYADKTSAFGSSPFAGFSVSPVMSTALHLADLVIPVGAIFAGLVGHWTLRTLVLIPAEIFGSSVRGWLAGL